MEYITASLTEHVNGYSVRVWVQGENSYRVDEIHEERIDALKALQTFFTNETMDELKRRMAA